MKQLINLEEIAISLPTDYGDIPLEGAENIDVAKVSNINSEGRFHKSFEKRTFPIKKLSKLLVKEGELLVVKSSGSKTNILSGKTAFCDNSVAGKLIASNFLIRLSIDESKAYPKYIWYVLNSKFSKKFIRKIVGATTYPNLKWSTYKTHPIPLPPLDEQRRIAKELDLSIKMRNLARSRISKINKIEASLFYMFFGDPLTNSKGWDRKRIKDIANIQTGNTPARENKNYYGSSIEWIKSDNLNNNDNYPTNAKEMLSKEGSKVGRIAQKDSILVTCIAGSPSCIGNSCLLNRAVAFNQQINSIELFTEESIFIYLQIKLYKRLIQNASNNSMKGMVNKKNFGEIKLITPPIAIQRKFIEKINLLRDFSLLINRSESLSSELLSSSSCKLMGRSL